MRYLPILFALFIFGNVSGQNWRTVTGDTTHFGGGYISNGIFGDAATLKVIWIDSVQVSGADSFFYFPGHMREMPDLCFDTLSPSWLGARMIRKQDGIEYYFNHFGDTITLNTLAQPGDAWTLASDTAGLTYKATLMQTGVVNVWGTQDSFKTLSIQAFSNGLPVSNPYNSKILKWTKEHGWLKTLDFYFFPNIYYLPNTYIFPGIKPDTGQIALVDRSSADLDPNYIDMQWRFAPGNEFISRYHSDGYMYRDGLRYDSVLSASLIHPDTIVVTMFSKNLSTDITYYPNLDTIISYNVLIHTDTIGRSSFFWMMTYEPLLPNINPGGGYGSYNQKVAESLFIDTVCGRVRIKDYNLHHGGLWESSCLMYSNGLSGYSRTIRTGLHGFGNTYYHYEEGQMFYFPEWDDTWQYTYIKTSDCSYGTKIAVDSPVVNIPVHMGSIEKQGYSLSLHPNPAKTQVTLYSTRADKDAVIFISDLTGRKLFTQQGLQQTNKLNVSELPFGIYLITVNGHAGTKNLKLVIY